MPLVVDCPSCQRKLRVPDELLGQRVQCPTCSTTFEAAAPAVVPISAVAPPATAPAEQHVQLSLDDEPQAVPAPVPPARRDHGPGDLEPFQCPRCDNSISPTAVRCRYCGAYLGKSGDWRDEAEYEYGLRRDESPMMTRSCWRASEIRRCGPSWSIDCHFPVTLSQGNGAVNPPPISLQSQKSSTCSRAACPSVSQSHLSSRNESCKPMPRAKSMSRVNSTASAIPPSTCTKSRCAAKDEATA